ncbi:unnamed protein product [Linum trigynum]|uniref:Aminotransferase-like plant mobile domain-containing protein n=1 Tax=Linum trigynum TaxID=586398 RepID=A0AAV2G9G4_9ROSI
MGELSWASTCLANIYHHLCNASLKAVREVGGFIIQFWAWEHLPWIAPLQCPDRNWGPDHPLRLEAYGCRWDGASTCDNLAQHKLVEYRRRLERLWEGEIKFDPYPANIDHWHLQQFPENIGQWCMRVPLICLGTVEWHLPDRCLRQFGREQCIPLEVPESQRVFHH